MFLLFLIRNEKQLFFHKIVGNQIQKMLDTYKTTEEWSRMLFPSTYDTNKVTKIDIDVKFAKQFPTRESFIVFKQSLKKETKKSKSRRNLLTLPTGYLYFACASTYIADYLNQDSVQTALHIKDAPTEWSVCNYDIFDAWPDSDWDNPMQKYYQQLVTQYSGQLKILIYSGDDDSVCGMRGTQYWLDRMVGWTTDDNEIWKAIEFDSQLAGYLTHYVDESSGESLLYFQTIHSAGHMVPQTEPGRAFALLHEFLYDLT